MDNQPVRASAPDSVRAHCRKPTDYPHADRATPKRPQQVSEQDHPHVHSAQRSGRKIPRFTQPRRSRAGDEAPRNQGEPLPCHRGQTAVDRGATGGGKSSPPVTITLLARKHQLSRSTLLYYDRIGLLRPSGRSAAGYRKYSPEDDARLARIGQLRAAGLPLATIGELMSAPEQGTAQALARRLIALNDELQRLREQQRLIVGLMGRSNELEQLAFMSRKQFVSLLTQGGFSKCDMERWHHAFERSAPQAHQQFLQFLCIPDDEIRAIRKASKTKQRKGR
jgi:MerR family transcriptional regulator, thiopeptide resistance regulator